MSGLCKIPKCHRLLHGTTQRELGNDFFCHRSLQLTTVPGLCVQSGLGNDAGTAVPPVTFPHEDEVVCWQDGNTPSPGMVPNLSPVIPALWETFL